MHALPRPAKILRQTFVAAKATRTASEPALRDSGSQAIFPRRIDRIATEAHGRFITVLGISLLAAIIWAALTNIDKVTRGSGRIVPQQHKQEVQHLEGGIISEILIKEGARVTAGQPLMRIENTFFRSELAQARIELAAKKLRLIRLEAETTGESTISFPPQLAQTTPQAVENETALFRRRHSNLGEQLSVLAQQARQKEIELSELRARQPSVLREKQIAEERLGSMKKLSAAGAASYNEKLDAERILQQAISRLSDLAHDIPRAEASLDEIGQRKLQILSNFQADAEKERTQTSTEIEKLTESINALHDRIRRSEVLASVDGVINKLNVSTVGGVVKPGEPLAEIVPDDSSISVEMKLSPSDRANVWPGEKAIVKVSAYEYSVYGGLPAKVVDISPDALQDEHGSPYFRVRLEANGGNFGVEHPVLPGMLADVDVIGERQSVLAALLKPLRRLKDNALRQ